MGLLLNFRNLVFFCIGLMLVKAYKSPSKQLLIRLNNNRLFSVKHKSYPPIPLVGNTLEHSIQKYKETYQQSIQNPENYWATLAYQYLSWERGFKTVQSGSLLDGDVSWFQEGRLNACYNCIDRHVQSTNSKVAIIWEGDEIGTSRTITYSQLQKEVAKIANVMLMQGIKKGDVVTIYMPMIPEITMVMLACSRIGAIHSVVFAGFSSEALKERIVDCKSNWVFTTDQGKRGGKTINLKTAVDAAVAKCPNVKNVFVYQYTNASDIRMEPDRDVWMHDLLPKVRHYCPYEVMNSEDPLFILYTSGSTGKPKGVVHSTAGYLLYAAMTMKNSFDLRENDVYCCAADCGWITGHSYIVYGPLLNGGTVVMFESIPTYPNPYRYWDLIQRYKVTQFYTAPTALRTLMKYDTEPIKNYDLSSLRILGSVGEPINPEAWEWYYEHIGKRQCSIVDTYWQTETGGHVITNLPGTVEMKPGSCCNPYYGIELAVLDAVTGKEIEGNNVEGILAIKSPWPSMARTVYGDHERFLNIYLKPYPGYYFTGDACRRDDDGSYWITGRVDDVINPSGHRIGTAELESALASVLEVSESAVVGFPHDVKGEGICCFVILKNGIEPSEALTQALKNSVRTAIGPIATPDAIIYADLPKTRSGKIMRRILRKIACGEYEALGDTSTLADPSVVQKLIEQHKLLKIAK